MSGVKIRRATLDEIPILQAAINPDEEQIPFHRSIAVVAEYEGQITHFGAARLVWLVEPLKPLPAARKMPRNAQRRAVVGIARMLEGWIGNRFENTTGIYSYFAHVSKRKFQQLCEAYGLRRWYPRTRLYSKEL